MANHTSKGQISTPVKIVVGLTLLMAAVALVLSVVRPSVLGLGSVSNRTVQNASGTIIDLII